MNRRALASDDWAKLILGLVLLLGLIVRVFPGLMAGHPLNDGGMFLVMIRDLRANHFALPTFTTYNFSSIPFAYPPLGLYSAAFLNLLGLDAISLLRWLPMVVNTLSILAFFAMAAGLLTDRPRAAVATAFFALVPGSYEWQIMGGGITRAFGIGFLVLAVWSMHRMYGSGDWRRVALAAVCCSLAALSHPEVTLGAAAVGALLWLAYGRNQRGIVQAGLVAAGTVLLTSIWWGSVLIQHGPAPFYSAMHSGAYVASPFKGLGEEFLSPARIFSIFGILRFAGLIWCVRHKKWFLPAWLFMPYFVEPRSAPAMAFMPACLISAIGFMDALPSVIEWLRTRRGQATAARADVIPAWRDPALLAIVMLLFIGSALTDFRLINTSLRPPSPQAAFDWVRAETPQESRFLILTGVTGIMSDPLQEWFPALADRRSQTTLQGLEWTLGPDFFPRLNALVDLQTCANVECVEEWSEQHVLAYSHVLLPKTDGALDLLESFAGNSSYQLVYENPEIVIFER